MHETEIYNKNVKMVLLRVEPTTTNINEHKAMKWK